MMMSDIQVGDIVSVEQYQNDCDKLITVGKVYTLSEKGGIYIGIQVGFQKYVQVKLCHCWNATPTQKKYFFKAMLSE